MSSFTHRVRVAFVDTDASGRIHFTAMLRHFEAAEGEFMRSLGCGYRDVMEEIVFPRVRVECEYRTALAFDDQLDIGVSVQRIGTSSYTLEFAAFKDGVLAANGSMVMVCVGRQTGRAQPLPDALRERLSRSAATAR
jgi:acyl-CoA thioester hydrolase